MAITATRSTTVTFTEGTTQTFAQTFAAAANAASPGDSDIVTLAAGFNLITPPTGGATPKGVTIIPPAGNVATLTLKGVTGDTGVLLHPTDPTSLALGSPTATFGLTASAEIAGVRLVWT